MKEMPHISNFAYTNTGTGDCQNPLEEAGIHLRRAVTTAGLGLGQAIRVGTPKFVQLFDTDNPKPNETMRRLVKVFVADPNPNIPLDKALLYEGKEKFTDADDQELFFELNISQILEDHNKLRATLPDKPASQRAGKDIFLEPARVRDLRMVVVTIASF